MNPQADVVKKGMMRFKTSKVRGTSGLSTQGGPKQYKDFWFVFRSLSGGQKVLDYYLNEKKFADVAPPKGSVSLRDAASLQLHNPDRKNQFCVEMSDGGMCFFETRADTESHQWMSCLNAVLFGKGTNGEEVLHYDVDLKPTPHLDYSGPCCLELRGDNLVVWTNDMGTQVARWKLAHIRSFKAKKNLLSIFAGSRSSTGACEFFFHCDHSVEITHAIETVVQKLKSERSQPPSSRNHASDHRPLPALPLHPHEPTRGGTSSPDSNHSSTAVPDLFELSVATRQPTASLIAAVPPAYEDLDKSERDDIESYGVLDHDQGPHAASAVPTPEVDKANGVSGGATGGGSSSVKAASKRSTRFDYEDIDIEEEEEYGKLDRQSSPKPAAAKASKELPPSTKPPQSSPSRLRKLFTKKKIPTPPKKPPPYQPGEEMYSEIETATALNVASSSGYNKLLRKGEGRGSGKIAIGGGGAEGMDVAPQYSQLNHTNSEPEIQVSSEGYGALDHNAKRRSQIVYRRKPDPQASQDDYGKLEHNKPVATPLFDQDYGQLNLNPASHPEEYGKLKHKNTAKTTPTPRKKIAPPLQEEEYGTLDHGLPTPPVDVPEYACIEDSRQSTFDPYGTLTEKEQVYDDTLQSPEIVINVASTLEEGRRKKPVQHMGNGDVYSVVSKPRKGRKQQEKEEEEEEEEEGPPPAIPTQHLTAPMKKPHSYINVDASGNIRNPKDSPAEELPPVPPRRGASGQNVASPPLVDNGHAKPRTAPKPRARPKPA